MHTIEYFSRPIIDFKYEFIQPRTTKHLIHQPPFRRPKDKGDYINRDIMLLGAPEGIFKWMKEKFLKFGHFIYNIFITALVFDKILLTIFIFIYILNY